MRWICVAVRRSPGLSRYSARMWLVVTPIENEPVVMRVLMLRRNWRELSDIAKRAPRWRTERIPTDRAIHRYLGPLVEEATHFSVARWIDFSGDIGDKSLHERSLPGLIRPDFKFVVLARRCIGQKVRRNHVQHS